MAHEDLRNQVHQFIQKNFIFDETRTIGDNESLLGSGVVDSTGILELISFLEEHFGVKFADSELVADNFDSVSKIIGFLSSKLTQVKA